MSKLIINGLWLYKDDTRRKFHPPHQATTPPEDQMAEWQKGVDAEENDFENHVRGQG